jgi:hypothetical protein
MSPGRRSAARSGPGSIRTTMMDMTRPLADAKVGQTHNGNHDLSERCFVGADQPFTRGSYPSKENLSPHGLQPHLGAWPVGSVWVMAKPSQLAKAAV